LPWLYCIAPARIGRKIQDDAKQDVIWYVGRESPGAMIRLWFEDAEDGWTEPVDVPRLVEEWARQNGHLAAWGDRGLLDLADNEVRTRRDNGELDAEFYRRWLDPTTAYRPALGPDATSVLLIAVRRPAHIVRFETRSGLVETIVPPVFIQDKAVPDRILDELTGLVGNRQRLEPMGGVQGLHKSVAARAGLVRYGRNNITSTPDFGSYFQIVPFVTDVEIPLDLRAPKAPQALDQCTACRSCQHACPTGAIGVDRFLLRAERCLTYFNEDVYDWPDWLPATSHHCLVGCMKCQESCPANAGKLKLETVPEVFTVQETRAILNDFSRPDDPQSSERRGVVWDSIRDKLTSFKLPWLERMIGRNMRALEKALGCQWS
jgi:epoxyqueuosine reductase